MAQFLRSVLQQDVALAASTQLNPIDLPVNPLSHILFTVRALNETSTITTYRFLRGFLDFITTFQVLFKGQAIISGNLTDLVILNTLLHGFVPVQCNAVETDNDSRSATFLISFARMPYWLNEAFPAVRRGELQLVIGSGALPTSMDGFTIQVETIELLGENPRQFLKYTTLSKTPTATGDHDVELPIGNPIAGVLLFGTSTPTGANFNASIGTVRVLVDNVETGYANTNWETLHGEMGRRLRGVSDLQGHIHSVDAAGAGREDTEQQEREDEIIENYAYLDYDPLVDGAFMLPTQNRAGVKLRINADVADAIRVIPVELVTVPGGAGRVVV